MANARTRASAKYQDKTGYIAKTYKLKRDDVEAFKKACEGQNESQASVITKMMKKYVEEANNTL